MKNIYIICSAVLMLQFSVNLQALSLGEVHHQVRTTITQIEALKAHHAANTQARVPGIQVGKTPLHAYTKGLELLAKIQKYQREKNLPQLSLPELPKKRVRSKNIMALVVLAEEQLQTITSSLSLKVSAIKQDTSSKTASDIYEKIWFASSLMDTFIEPVHLGEVMQNAQRMELGLIDIAKRRGKEITFPKRETFSDKQSADVTIALYKLLYKVAKLERKIKLKPLLVPAFPAGDITPQDAYAASGNVIADLTRIALKLKIPPMAKAENTVNNATANDVYAQVVRLNKAIELLL